MKRALKYIGLGLGAIVLLLIVALVSIPLFFNANDFKPQLISLVKAQTGATLTIKGPMDWSFFPVLGLSIKEAALVAPNAAEQPAFAQLNRVVAGVKVMPLLSGRVAIDSLQIDGLVLNLSTNPQGVANWQFLTQAAHYQTKSSSQQQPSTQQSTSGHGATEQPGTEKLALAIAKLALTHSAVHYVDQRTGQKVSIDNLDVYGSDVQLERPFPVKVDWQLVTNQPSMEINNSLSGRLTLNLNQQRYGLDQLVLDSQLSGEPFGGKTVELKVKGNLAADVKNQQVSLTDLSGQLANLVLTGGLKVQSFDQPQFTGQLAIAQFSPRQLLASLGQSYQPASSKVLEKASLTTDIGGLANSLQLQNLRFDLDDSQLTGQAGISNLKTGAMDFDLALNKLNVDQYLPKSTSTTPSNQAKVKAPADQATAAATPLPVDFIRQLKLAGQLTIGQLIFANINNQQVKLALQADGGTVRLKELSSRLYGGQLQASGTLAAQGDQLRVNLNQSLSQTNIQPLLKDVLDVNLLSGHLTSQANLTTYGKTQQQLLPHLRGRVNLSVRDGVLDTGDTLERLSNNLNRLAGPLLGSKLTLLKDRNAFKVISTGLTINRGVATINQFLGDFNQAQVTGEGTVNLVKQATDSYFYLKLDPSLIGGKAKFLAEQKWPVHCQGPFTAGAKLCGPDTKKMGRLLEDVVKQQAVGQLEKRLKERLTGKGDQGDKSESVDQLKNKLLDRLFN
jgi:AsmA protein